MSPGRLRCRVGLLLLPAFSACGPVPQPESLRTVAAYEVPLTAAGDREMLQALLRRDAEAEGFHLDASTAEELKWQSEVSPMSINATVWRGKDDDEPVASVIDGPDHLGLAWLTFSLSDEPARTARFRDRVMKRIVQRWPNTATLPITPSGGIPLRRDLVLTGRAYRVKRQAASIYGFPASSPFLTDAPPISR